MGELTPAQPSLRTPNTSDLSWANGTAMTHNANRSKRDAELAYRATTLARFVRSAPRFTDALRWWAGFDLRREPRIPDQDCHLDDHAALLLDLPPGTRVTRRDGYLVSAIPGESFRVAAAVALVYQPALALDNEQRTAFRSGTVPLSQILNGGQRATHYACRVAGDPHDDHTALQSRATLLRGGRPVALVDETVYWRLITHRAPGQPPHYLQIPQHGPTGW
jgi:hypothetical protein